jgi:hypothetical protein
MATQGRDLREKVEDEFSQLAQPQRSIYAAIALASQYRYGINRDEVLHAADALTAVGATALERLVKRQLVVAKRGGLESRHRMVAELVTQRMRADGTLAGAYGRLLVALAMRQSPAELKDPGLRQRSRRYRVTQTLMNHRSLDGFRMREARAIYSGAEPYLSQDYHYWLQRGSFEVRRGDRDRAERYLLRSRAEGGDNDFRVDVETYYLQVKKAAANPADGAAVTLADEAYAGLVHMIDTRGQQSAYPFHVLLSQYPKWLAAANLTVGEKRLKFEDLRRLANRAVRQHGNDAGMQDLQRSIEREYLSLAVAKTGRGGGRGRGRSRGGRPS